MIVKASSTDRSEITLIGIISAGAEIIEREQKSKHYRNLLETHIVKTSFFGLKKLWGHYLVLWCTIEIFLPIKQINNAGLTLNETPF